MIDNEYGIDELLELLKRARGEIIELCNNFHSKRWNDLYKPID